MKIYLVGGAVRDKLLGLPVKERDWVVVGATTQEMLNMGYRQVGKEFPVFLHPKTNEEYALARMEKKINLGYKGFTFDTSPLVTLQDDLIRRDLTINAMAWDPQTDQLIDPYQGKKDLEDKILRHVSPAFAEDPVRILRVGRFLARYAHLGFRTAPETLVLMRQMVEAGEVNALVAERVWKELERALGEKNPEKFFAILNECGALSILFPLIDIAGIGIKALEKAAQLNKNTLIRFCVLLHAVPDKNEIAALSRRYRIPNAYRELSLLTAQYCHMALRAKTLSATELLQFFSTLDIFRREDRFNQFVEACCIISLAQNKVFDAPWLLAAAHCAKSIDVKVFLAEGLTGTELAIRLKEERRKKIKQWISGST